MKIVNTKIKNNKGFSLLEVLVGVSIIGIISAIAVPTFTEYRNKAAITASDTSASNIIKSFRNCMSLNTFNSCNTLSGLNIGCPAGADCNSGGASGRFCAHIKNGTAGGGDDYNVCVSATIGGSVTRTYGGDLLNYEICYIRVSGCTGANAADDNKDHPVAGPKKCAAPADCGTTATYTCTTSGTATATYKCQRPNNTTGTCNISNGICS